MSKKFKVNKLSSLVAMTLVAQASVYVSSANAQDVKLEKTEITGSSLKRVNAQSALPISIIKADDFAKQGISTVEEALTQISQNQSNVSSINTIGSTNGGRSEANLRGFGTDKTLVLLDGKRLANNAYDGGSVDLNAIPLAAIDRIEILSDGASAVYGTDAIGGVINFITKKTFTGLTVGGKALMPQKSGGKQSGFDITAGTGNLSEDGFNIMGSYSYQKNDHIKSQDRDYAKTGIIPERGLNKTSGYSWPANFNDPGTGITGNPTNCNPPYSVKNAAGVCRQDYTRSIQLTPDVEQHNFVIKGTAKIANNATGFLQYIRSTNLNTGKIAPAPLTLNDPFTFLPASSPYYPGNGIVPWAGNALSGQTLNLQWRPFDVGQRVNESYATNDRLLANVTGKFDTWDYKFNIAKAQSYWQNRMSGYLNVAMIQEGLNAGILNPFANYQTGAGLDWVKKSEVKGVGLTSNYYLDTVDFTASRSLFELDGGSVDLAVGGELKRESIAYKVDHSIVDQAAGSGLSDSKDVAGKRNIKSLYSELSIPAIQNLDLQLAARYDDYQGTGESFNPKIALRYKAHDTISFRASVASGFRAPSLKELYDPQSKTNTSDNYDDPVLCPNGVPTANAVSTRDCGVQFNQLNGGNTELTPEKSRSITYGFVFEPMRSMQVSVDWWSIVLKDRIDTLAEQAIFADPVKYANLFHRRADGSIDYITATNQNLGEIRGKGIDLRASYAIPTEIGNFDVSLDGTYMQSYKYQDEKGGAFKENVGRYLDNNPVFRWKHNLSLKWRMGDYSALLNQTHYSGYDDQNAVAAKYRNKVSAYDLWNLSGSMKLNKEFSVTLGVRNLFDKKPPFTNQATLFQQGFDPRYTDVVGRAYYLQASYKFF